MELTITGVDYAPPELNEQVPFKIKLTLPSKTPSIARVKHWATAKVPSSVTNVVNLFPRRAAKPCPECNTALPVRQHSTKNIRQTRVITVAGVKIVSCVNILYIACTSRHNFIAPKWYKPPRFPLIFAPQQATDCFIIRQLFQNLVVKVRV